jgi:GNAT superfamily N-acetyltransferase
VRPRVRKLRRRDDAVLAIEQTHDHAELTALLAASGLPAGGLELSNRCCLAARVGGRSVGVAAIETRLDVAVLGTLTVIAERRRQGIGAALLAGARSAAHTRGARSFYALAPPSVAEFLRRSGFTPAPMSEAITALKGTFVGDRLSVDPVKPERCQAWLLDISRDGIIHHRDLLSPEEKD